MRVTKPWLPSPEAFRKYLDRDVEIAVANLTAGNAPRDTLHSSRVLCAAIQTIRNEVDNPPWGSMPRDPRRFSSTPKKASAAQVKKFVAKAIEKAGAK